MGLERGCSSLAEAVPGFAEATCPMIGDGATVRSPRNRRRPTIRGLWTQATSISSLTAEVTSSSSSRSSRSERLLP